MKNLFSDVDKMKVDILQIKSKLFCTSQAETLEAEQRSSSLASPKPSEDVPILVEVDIHNAGEVSNLNVAADEFVPEMENITVENRENEFHHLN